MSLHCLENKIMKLIMTIELTSQDVFEMYAQVRRFISFQDIRLLSSRPNIPRKAMNRHHAANHEITSPHRLGR